MEKENQGRKPNIGLLGKWQLKQCVRVCVCLFVVSVGWHCVHGNVLSVAQCLHCFFTVGHC